jgi:hypothetical protein
MARHVIQKMIEHETGFVDDFEQAKKRVSNIQFLY